MRFFFYYPTWKKPSGGFKQIRLMASLLRELGVETFLLRDRGFFAPGGGFDDDVFYATPIQTAPFPFDEAGAHLSQEDVLLLAEVNLERTLPICQSWKCRLALNNQNGFLSLYDRPSRTIGRTFEFAIANAPYVATICRDFLGVPAERIFHVPHWIVRGPFEYQDEKSPRSLAVCYMPRKLAEEGRRVRELVRQTHPDIPWVEIDGLSESQVAAKLRAHAIFFAAQHLEGCPLPALESMSCGCLVTGFAGTAGLPHPYATPANGIWVPDRNVSAAATAVRRSIEIVREAGTTYKNYLEAGLRTAKGFTRETSLARLSAMLEVVREQSYRDRKHTVSGLGWRGNLLAYKLLYDGGRLGWPGRLVSKVSQWTKPIRRALSSVHR